MVRWRFVVRSAIQLPRPHRTTGCILMKSTLSRSKNHGIRPPKLRKDMCHGQAAPIEWPSSALPAQKPIVPSAAQDSENIVAVGGVLTQNPTSMMPGRILHEKTITELQPGNTSSIWQAQSTFVTYICPNLWTFSLRDNAGATSTKSRRPRPTN